MRENYLSQIKKNAYWLEISEGVGVSSISTKRAVHGGYYLQISHGEFLVFSRVIRSFSKVLFIY